MTARYEILEHTADVGLRCTGDSPEEVLEAAGRGLADLQGAWFPGEGVWRDARVVAADDAAMLPAWVDELLYVEEAEDVVFGGFDVRRAGGGIVEGSVRVAPRGDRPMEGVGVKAATYHRLRLERLEDGSWVGECYLDV